MHWATAMGFHSLRDSDSVTLMDSRMQMVKVMAMQMDSPMG